MKTDVMTMDATPDAATVKKTRMYRVDYVTMHNAHKSVVRKAKNPGDAVRKAELALDFERLIAVNPAD